MQDATRQHPDPWHRAASTSEAGGGGTLAACPACGGVSHAQSGDSPALWPRLLGGEFALPPFRSSAFCASCARLGDLAIDDIFLKNWSMQAQQVRSALSFLDRETPLAAPLTFLGLAADYRGEDGTFCERWAGLAGEQIFHIHHNPDIAWSGHAGAQAFAREPDPGVVTLRLSDASAYWRQIANLSVAAYFPRAQRFIVDVSQQSNTGQPGTIAFDSLYAPHQRAWLHSAPPGRLTLHPDLAQRGPQRFLIKLALALGRALLGPAFMRTSHARHLRRNFWSARPQVRSGHLAESLAEAATILGCPPARLGFDGAWTLVLGPMGREYGLCLIPPAGQALHAVIADDAALWEEARDTIAYVVVPTRHAFIGPLPLRDLARHQAGLESDPELARLDALRLSPAHLPTRRGLM